MSTNNTYQISTVKQVPLAADMFMPIPTPTPCPRRPRRLA